ncbi:DICT sensory domain-containing protein [Haloarcula litorea]|uniref:DICT sensory domain-containing protein n=1 Tax=Haloarcula litorea TaxID=3032579 RepID=UPI0023E78EF2|nr:DICT sensory domain-containing protein [Halomicroarcula sp. GDY20]
MFESIRSAASESRKRFVVYAAEDTDLTSQFATHSVTVDHRPLPPDGPAPFVVIEDDGEFAGAIPLADLDVLLEPPVVRPADPDEVSPGYRALFEVLDETVYTALTRRQLLVVTREIEDRAARVEQGALGVSFQTRAAFEAQVDVYRHLAAETALDIDVYLPVDWTPPAVPGLTVHTDEDGVLAPYWVLVFIGPVRDQFSCALVARETDDGYDGVWTDDPELARHVADELAARG